MKFLKHYIVLAILLMAGEIVFSQVVIVKNDGSVVNAHWADLSDSLVYYQTDDFENAPIFRIKKADVLVIRYADGTTITPNIIQPKQPSPQSLESSTPLIESQTFPDIDLNDYQGFLLNKGNRVYVAYNSQTDYEVAAVDVIKKSIEQNGLWQVVEQPSQAHFVLQYNVCLLGRDAAYLILRPRENYELIPYLESFGWKAPTPNSLFWNYEWYDEHKEELIQNWLRMEKGEEIINIKSLD